MLIIERSDDDDFMMIKLVYSISISGNTPSYTITVGKLNKTQSFFYFDETQINEYNKIDGCSILHKEYTIEYIYYIL